MTIFNPPGDYLPHEAPMILLDRVIAVSNDDAHCQVSINASGVLAPFLDSEGNLPGWYALELIAQTIGVWSGWHRQQQGEQRISLGMVLGARELTCSPGVFLAGETVDIHVHLLMQDTRFGSFEAEITHQDEIIAKGRVNTFQPSPGELDQLFNKGNTP